MKGQDDVRVVSKVIAKVYDAAQCNQADAINYEGCHVDHLEKKVLQFNEGVSWQSGIRQSLFYNYVCPFGRGKRVKALIMELWWDQEL